MKYEIKELNPNWKSIVSLFKRSRQSFLKLKSENTIKIHKALDYLVPPVQQHWVPPEKHNVTSLIILVKLRNVI